MHGFIRSISRSFHARCHSFSAFSRWIALAMVGCASYQTSRCTPYRCVKPGTAPVL